MIMARVKAPAAILAESLEAPHIIGDKSSQLLFGESFVPEKQENDFWFGTSLLDGYQGYVHEGFLSFDMKEPTHAVTALSTQFYPGPDFKMMPLMPLSMMSRVCLSDERKDGFAKVPDFGWVFENHLTPLNKLSDTTDFVETALQFLNAPYYYGARAAFGIDCSGLVQIALQRCGHTCPRDTDEQCINVGHDIEKTDIQRGDLVFFKGHVGIMLDNEEILNATSRTMDVRIEKLSDLIDIYDGITAVRRIA